MAVPTLQLRQHVEVDLGPNGVPVRLRDTLLGRTVDLSACAAQVVLHLNRANVVELVHNAGHSRLAAGSALQTLMALNLCEGSGNDMVAAVADALTDPLRNGVVTLPGAAFSCQGSGECCQNHRLGPLSAQDVARLEHTVGSHCVEARQAPNQAVQHYLRQEDGHCTFLQPDRRCGLHAQFGPKAKPGFCQLYPLVLFPTFQGLKLYDRGGCASFAEAMAKGESVQAHAYAPLYVPQPLYHPMVSLGGRPVDYAHHVAFCRYAQDIIRTPHHPVRNLVAVHRALADYTDALASFPIAVGQPQTALDAWLAQPPVRFFDAPAPGAFDSNAWRALMRDVTVAVARLARRPISLDPGAAHAGALHALVDGWMKAADPRVPEPSGAQAQALQWSNAWFLFGQRSLVADQPVPALLRQTVAVSLALMAKSASGPLQLAGQGGFNHAHMLAQRVLDLVEEVFVEHAPHAQAILEGWPLAGLAPASV